MWNSTERRVMKTCRNEFLKRSLLGADKWLVFFLLPSKIVIRQKLGVAGPPEPPLWSVLRRRQEIF